MQAIVSFKGTFLSNMYPGYGMTTETLYQAEKAADETDRKRILATSNPYDAKRLAKTIRIKPNWNEIRLDVMEKVLRKKFSVAAMKTRLIETGDAQLIEGNYWHDNFWGSCTCKRCGNKGRNELGKLLMKIRDEMRTE